MLFAPITRSTRFTVRIFRNEIICKRVKRSASEVETPVKYRLAVTENNIDLLNVMLFTQFACRTYGAITSLMQIM